MAGSDLIPSFIFSDLYFLHLPSLSLFLCHALHLFDLDFSSCLSHFLPPHMIIMLLFLFFFSWCLGLHLFYECCYDWLVSGCGNKLMIQWPSPGPEEGEASMGRDSNPTVLSIIQRLLFSSFFFFFSLNIYFLFSEANLRGRCWLPSLLELCSDRQWLPSKCHC